MSASGSADRAACHRQRGDFADPAARALGKSPAIARVDAQFRRCTGLAEFAAARDGCHLVHATHFARQTDSRSRRTRLGRRRVSRLSNALVRSSGCQRLDGISFAFRILDSRGRIAIGDFLRSQCMATCISGESEYTDTLFDRGGQALDFRLELFGRRVGRSLMLY